MGTVPTVYRWDDAGVPGRPGGTSNADRVNYLGSILRACLVTGYGTKSAAGWSELHHQFASPGDGRLVLQNGTQTGVVDLVLGLSNNLSGTEVGVDWSDGALQGSPGSYIYGYNIIDNPQTMRWAVIANQSGALLLTWRDPASLTGDSLSDYNNITLYIGSMLPWGSEINPNAAPNMVAYAPFRIYDHEYSGNFMDTGCSSLIEPDGSQSVSQGMSSFEVLAGAYNWSESRLRRNVSQALLVPAGVCRDDVVFARIPGWFCAINQIQETQLLTLRDNDGLWTGDEITFQGAPAILVATQARYSVISLDGEHWP